MDGRIDSFREADVEADMDGRFDSFQEVDVEGDGDGRTDFFQEPAAEEDAVAHSHHPHSHAPFSTTQLTKSGISAHAALEAVAAAVTSPLHQ